MINENHLNDRRNWNYRPCFYFIINIKSRQIFIINFIHIAENNMPNNMNNDPINW